MRQVNGRVQNTHVTNWFPSGRFHGASTPSGPQDRDSPFTSTTGGPGTGVCTRYRTHVFQLILRIVETVKDE